MSDVDSTFLTQEVIELVADHAGVRDQVERITESAMRGELDFTESLRERVALLAGLEAEALTHVQAALVPTPGAIELVQRAQASGWVVALVSGGFHDVIDPLAEQIGIDHVVANRFEIRHGQLTGKVEGSIVTAEVKEQTLRELARRYQLPLARTVAVGDGANDAKMVRAAGLGIAFRGKPALREVADVCIEGNSLLHVWPHLEEIGARS